MRGEDEGTGTRSHVGGWLPTGAIVFLILTTPRLVGFIPHCVDEKTSPKWFRVLPKSRKFQMINMVIMGGASQPTEEGRDTQTVLFPPSLSPSIKRTSIMMPQGHYVSTSRVRNPCLSQMVSKGHRFKRHAAPETRGYAPKKLNFYQVDII